MDILDKLKTLISEVETGESVEELKEDVIQESDYQDDSHQDNDEEERIEVEWDDLKHSVGARVLFEQARASYLDVIRLAEAQKAEMLISLIRAERSLYGTLDDLKNIYYLDETKKWNLIIPNGPGQPGYFVSRGSNVATLYETKPEEE